MKRGGALESFGLGALLLALAGCFTADATVQANGSGTIELTYIPDTQATIESETARFTSPHVTVQELVPRQVGAFLRVTFDDVTKLSTAAGFSALTVRRDRKHGEERLRATIRNRAPKQIPEQERPGPQISMRLPGRVLHASQGAKIAGDRVSWRIPLHEFARAPAIVLSVRYRAS